MKKKVTYPICVNIVMEKRGRDSIFKIEEIKTPLGVPVNLNIPPCRTCCCKLNLRDFYTVANNRVYVYVCSEECANFFILKESGA